MILGLTPEPFGYGSPQQNYLLDSLSNLLNSNFKLIAPNAPIGKSLTNDHMETFIGLNHPWSYRGALERAKYARRYLNDANVVVLVNPASLLLVPYLSKKQFVIYLGLEPFIDHGMDFQRVFLRYASRANLYIYPNFERAKLEADAANLNRDTIYLVKNVNSQTNQQPVSVSDRKFNFIYSGNLDADKVDLSSLENIGTLGETRVYGSFAENSESISNINYRGLKPNVEILAETRLANFGLTLWKPTSFGRKNASPNKIYNSLAQGTPIVSYPYPEVKQLVARYGCGFISQTFDPGSLVNTAQDAMKSLVDGSWAKISMAAYSSHLQEFNWEYQIAPVLESIMLTL